MKTIKSSYHLDKPIFMNKWQVTAVVKNAPILNEEGTYRILNFTAVHTPEYLLADGTKRKDDPLWIDCSWNDPPDKWPEIVTEKALLYLDGECYWRQFPRKDGSFGYTVAMRVKYGKKHAQYGSKEPTGPSGPPENKPT